MKKFLGPITLMLALVCILAACNKAHVHTEVVDEAVAPTATETGLTEGKHCSVCQEILVKQEVVPALGTQGLAYKVNDDGKTCTITGRGTNTDKSIYISDTIDGYTVTGIADYAFGGCDELTNVIIGNSVITIGESAFEICGDLTSVTIGKSVTTIGEDAFCDCWSLKSFIVDKDNTTYKSQNGDLYSKDGTKLITYAVGKVNTTFKVPNSVTTIGKSAFERANLKIVTIPDSVTTIEERAFYDCAFLKSVTIPDSVTSIGDSAFYSCYSLTSVEIGDGVTSIGNSAFQSCYFLTSVEIGDGVESIGYEAFAWCDALTSITIPDGVTSIGDSAFEFCSSLTSVTFGGTIEQWNAIEKVSSWNYSTGSYTVYCTDGEIAEDETVTYY